MNTREAPGITLQQQADEASRAALVVVSSFQAGTVTHEEMVSTFWQALSLVPNGYVAPLQKSKK